MPPLDLRTVIILSVFVAFMTGWWMLTNRSLQKGFSGFGYLAAGHFGLGISFLLLALRGILPDFISIVIANTLLVLAIILAFMGIQAFRRVEVKGALLCLLGLLVMIGACFHFTYVHPSLKDRLLFGDFVLILLLSLCVRTLLKDREEFLQLPLFATAAPLLVGIGLSLARIAVILNGQAPASFTQGGFIFSLQFIVADMILVGTALGFTSMANRRLTYRLEKEALTDPLTDTFNRRGIEKIAEKLLDGARRQGEPLSLLLIDLDHFKRVNDSLGHPAGDSVLLQFALLAQKHLRRSDVFGRYGGEEFVAVLPGMETAEAFIAAERLRTAVVKSGFSYRRKPVRLTVSIGIASFPGDGAQWLRLLDRADEFMYQAKQSGRNRVCPVPA
jgi:diguanylate cyclase (GGDEF)-like protein